MTGSLRVVGQAAGVAPVSLSRDGRTMLGTTNPHNTYNGTNVVTLPYRGGAPHTLLKQASFPSWTL